MLRLYKPIQHDIFKLHAMLYHLVSKVWCCSDAHKCETKLHSDFKIIYNKYGGLKKDVDEIYDLCKTLTPQEKALIKFAFYRNNSIETLCNGGSPKYLDKLPNVVDSHMKPLFVSLYETLLERKLTPGTKKDYYEKLIIKNDFQYCPCCGLSDFEEEDSKYREAFDHYLPKSKYPFASINFANLVPLCYKCNSDRKKDKDPIENGRLAFYPFSKEKHIINIQLLIDPTKSLDKLKKKDIRIELWGNNQKLETWDYLFDIKKRYKSIVRKKMGKAHLRKLKRRDKDFRASNSHWSFNDTLNYYIKDYKNDYYDDKKFLAIPFMQYLLTIDI